MERKVFLGKYRVAADEIALEAAEPSNVAIAIEPTVETCVYRGEEIASGRDVTVEVIPAARFKNAVREQLEAEAVEAKKISHINIPALYDFGVEDDQLIYITEYIEGSSAEEWVNEHGPMPTGAVLRIALQVIGAMGAAAFHKISHHAINPANLILVPGQTPEGDWPLVKVLHFVGVAPTLPGADISVASFDKSTHYASPEQLQHGKVDFRSEIYSLGATMWFLLTGAPPLVAPKDPLAMQATTTGLPAEKLNGMPRKVRRLLALMLSPTPDNRPQDPLALYRHLQDCIAQIDRRESMARRFGVPLLSGSNVVALPSRRRFPAKMIALAAALIAIATLGVVLIPQYLRQQRVRQAEEPIGVPIGVPDATVSTPPAANTNPPVVASTVTQPEAPVQTSTAPENQPPPPAPVETSTPVVAANTQPVAPAPVQKTATQENPPPAPAVASTPAVVAENKPIAPPPVQTEKPAPPANDPPAKPPTVAANERKVETASAPAETEGRESARNRNTEVAAIPTARPVAPEVRRAEPAPPAEGPEEIAEAPTPTEKKVAKVKKPRATKPTREPGEAVIARNQTAEDDEEVVETLPSLPPGRTRARFIGVTADGNWMFSLPSKKIVIVPPPPGG